MKIKYSVLLVFTLATSFFAQTNYDAKIFHPFSGKFALSIDGGITYSRTDFKNNAVDYLTRASLDFYLPTLSFGAFGFKVFGGAGYLTGNGSPSSSYITENFRTLIYSLVEVQHIIMQFQNHLFRICLAAFLIFILSLKTKTEMH